MASAPHFGIFYSQKGMAIHLLHLFENGLTQLPADLIVSAPELQTEFVE